MKGWMVLRAAALWLGACAATAAAETREAYRIEAGDTVAVYLNGELSLERPRLVDRDGAVPVQFAGNIVIDGLTTEQAAALIERELVDRGLFSAVDVLVLVEERRPVYVLGFVERPGAYPSYQATTVAKALALAGGPRTAPELAGGSYSAFFQYYNAEASLFEQRREHLRATLAVQRVNAQLAGAAAPSFEPPEDPGVPPELVEEAVAAERELFELLERTHAEARDRAFESIQLLEDEIRTVDARREELAGLVDILAEEAQSSADLFKRGLRTQAINVASQRNLSLARVDLLEMERAFTLAQQRVAAERRDLNELELTRELDLRKERVARSDAAAAAESRIASLRQIALFPVLPQGQTAVAAAPGLHFVVERREDDGVERIEADEHMELEPGDLLVVSADLDAG
jgi:hypothetical protein